jgi:hypothetical protein
MDNSQSRRSLLIKLLGGAVLAIGLVAGGMVIGLMAFGRKPAPPISPGPTVTEIAPDDATPAPKRPVSSTATAPPRAGGAGSAAGGQASGV